MKKTLFVFSALSGAAYRLSKEPAFQDPGTVANIGTTAAGQLVRSVIVEGNDSNVTVYNYDVAGRFTGYKIADAAGSASVSTTLVRSTAGIITQLIHKSPDLSATFGLDSLITVVYYNAATARYTYTLTVIDLAGVRFSDSAALAYDAAGNVSSITDFNKSSLSPYSPNVRKDFMYAGGNIVSQKIYDRAAGVWELAQNLTYTYDVKASPLKLGAEAILLEMTGWYGTNNLASEQSAEPNDPANNYTQTTTYAYNPANKPVTGTITELPGPVAYSLRFYYN